jgi:hypothetical protein
VRRRGSRCEKHRAGKRANPAHRFQDKGWRSPRQTAEEVVLSSASLDSTYLISREAISARCSALVPKFVRTGTDGLRLHESARVSDFVRFDGPYLRSLEGGHRDGLPFESQKLDFVSLTILVDVDDRSHVAGKETLGFDIGLQYHSIVLFDHRGSRRGYAVTRRGAAPPFSRIQTVLTRGLRPFGLASSPLNNIARPEPRFYDRNHLVSSSVRSKGRR